MPNFSSGDAREDPRITDWYAIDLMAYGKKGEKKICAICGGEKRPSAWVCFGCHYKWGKEAERLVQMEIGRRNLNLWSWLVGENLSPKKKDDDFEGVYYYAGRKVKPISKKNLAKDPVIDEKPTALVVEKDEGSVLKDNLLVSEEEQKPVDQPVEVILVEIPSEEQREVFKTTSDGPEKLNGEENQTVPPTIVKRLDAIPNDVWQKAESKLKEKVPQKGGESMTSQELTEQELSQILTEKDWQQISDDKVEIIPGLWVFDDVMEMMSNWNFWKRVLCPVCKGYKQAAWWLCDKCDKEPHSQRNRWIVQWEVSKREPHAKFINGNLLSPKQEQTLLGQAIELLNTPLRDIFQESPGRFGTTIGGLPAIPHHKRPVAFFILGKIALEAIELWKRAKKDEELSSIASCSTLVEPVEQIEETSGDSARKKAQQVQDNGTVPATDSEEITLSDTEPVDSVDLEQVEKIVQEALPEIGNKLENNTDIAKAFFTFLEMRFEIWKSLRKKERKGSTQGIFFKEISCSMGGWYNLKNTHKMSLAKARKIARFFGTTFKEAVAAGFQLKGGRELLEKYADSVKVVDDSPPLDPKSHENSGDVSAEKFFELLDVDQFKEMAEKLLLGVQNNLKENEEIASIFLVFLEGKIEDWRNARIAEKKSTAVLEFFKTVPISDVSFYSFKRSFTCSLKKAKELAEFFGTTLEKIVVNGLMVSEMATPVKGEAEPTDSGDDDKSPTDKAGAVSKKKAVLTEKQILKSQTMLDAIKGNLKDNPDVAKAFAAFVDGKIGPWKSAGNVGGAATFCKEVGFSYQGLVALRKGGTKLQGLSLEKANEVAGNFEISLDQIIAIGLTSTDPVDSTEEVNLNPEKSEGTPKFSEEARLAMIKQAAEKNGATPEGVGDESIIKNLSESVGAGKAFTAFVEGQKNSWIKDEMNAGRNAELQDFCKFIGISLGQYEDRLKKPEAGMNINVAEGITDKLGVPLMKALKEGRAAALCGILN